jgi:hypothetical protein
MPSIGHAHIIRQYRAVTVAVAYPFEVGPDCAGRLADVFLCAVRQELLEIVG